MEPGKKLDKLVAEEVMDMTGLLHHKPYSTDISAAWEVVEKFNGYTVVKNDENLDDEIRYGSRIEHNGRYYFCGMQSKSAPHAICLAALKAVGYNKENGKEEGS